MSPGALRPPPPPPPTGSPAPRTPPPPARQADRSGPLTVIVIGIVGVVVLAGVALFAAGEDLFGSDPGTIDSYNREMLESCDLPEDSTFVREYVTRTTDSTGRRLRALSFVYASPLSADELAGFYDATPGAVGHAPASRACRFGNRPQVLVLPVDVVGPGTAPSGNGFWGDDTARVPDADEVPDGTQSFVRLRLAQREVDGLLGIERDDRSLPTDARRPT